MAREMKDSGIPWIGEIPTSWTISRIKNEFLNLDYLREPISAEKRDNKLRLYDYYGASGVIDKIDQYNVDDTVLLIGEDGANLRMRNLPLIYRASGKFWVNNHAHILKVKPDNNYSYMAYLLETGDYSVYITGSAQPKLSQFNLMNFQIVVPPVCEQVIIAKYLDTQCAEIDAVLDKTRTSIEEYKKLKQAIITQAVTKGVRGDRPMKESGIGGIDKIPADWSVYKFSHIASVKCNLVPPQEYLDYPQVSPENIEKGSGKLLPCKTVRDSGVVSGNHLFFEGQILYSKIRPKLNKVCIAPFSGLCSADMYPIETESNTKFIVYYMRSDAFLNQVAMITEDRVKMPKINQNELGAILVAIPPEKSEQVEIAEYLDQSCAKIDELISKEERLVLELETYKKSLIYEYVTGKKEVSV